jgi:UDPglucose 6-dehydrogenase
MTIAIAGTGYVGLITAVSLASIGHNVVCVDVSKERIKMLNEFKEPFYEPGLREIRYKYRDKLSFTTDYKTTYEKASVIFICVGTPEDSHGQANLEYVMDVVNQVEKHAKAGAILVVKSTVPVGTCRFIQAALKGKHIYVGSNPEFLAQGTAIRDTLEAARIVIGAKEEYVLGNLENLYKDLNQPIVKTSWESAEMIKYTANNFLALKISYTNEIANLCEAFGADIEDVMKAVGMDPRIGDKFLQAGIGYGGSCFPKDTKALVFQAKKRFKKLSTIESAIVVNETQKYRLIDKAYKYVSSFQGKKVAVLGVTFKPGTDDLREAPSIPNIKRLKDLGANIKVWDPLVKDCIDGVEFCDTINQALNGAEICFIFTEHDEIKAMSTREFQVMKTPIVMDGRNCFPLEKFKFSDVLYDSIGRQVPL